MATDEFTPPARHFCMSPYHQGPRWMLAVFFYRNKRHRTGLQSYCTTCTKIQMKPENTSDRVKQYRKKYTREYKEKKRRENNVPRRNLVLPYFRGPQLSRYLERFISERETGTMNQPTVFLNGIPLDDNDGRILRRFKETQRVGLETVDYFATKYHLQLWEIIEEAGCYKRDKRDKKKRGRRTTP